MKKTLVVYYSRSGFTRHAAERLARALDADLDEIREFRSRDGLRGWLRSAYEAVMGVRPGLQPPKHHPRAYRRVIVGTPVWAGHPSSPVRSYVMAHKNDLHHFSVFLTCGGSPGKALDEIEALLGRAAEHRLVLTDREIHAGDDAHEAVFVKSVLNLA